MPAQAPSSMLESDKALFQLPASKPGQLQHDMMEVKKSKDD